MCGCGDTVVIEYKQPTFMHLTLQSCIESMIEFNEDECELSVVVNADWVRYVVDWCMWGGSEDKLLKCVTDVTAELVRMLELDGEADKEFEAEEFRDVVDGVVFWLETQYEGVKVDETE